jgi:hypothetical protein
LQGLKIPHLGFSLPSRRSGGSAETFFSPHGLDSIKAADVSTIRLNSHLILSQLIIEFFDQLPDCYSTLCKEMTGFVFIPG